MTVFITAFTLRLSNSFSKTLNTNSCLTVSLCFISTTNTVVKPRYEVLTGGRGRTTKVAVSHTEEGSSRCMCNKLNVITFLNTQILRLSNLNLCIISKVVSSSSSNRSSSISNNSSSNSRSSKSKAIPLQPCTDPEGSRRLRLPDFKTVGTRGR